MINYIRKDNEKYKNNVMKNKFSNLFLLPLKKIGCSPYFLRWSIKWFLVLQDRNHMVAIRCFLVEILELNYGATKVLMLLCSWVQPSTRDVHAGTKVDEFGFTLVNFRMLLLIQEQPFVFLSQVDQMFFSDFT